MAKDGRGVRTHPVNPLNDVLFKYLFAAKENRANLLRLLNDVLGPERRVSGVKCLDRETDPSRFGGHTSFLDVLARSRDGRVFHVEVQLANEENFFERVTYYAACSLSDQLSRGEGYDCLRPVVFVSILKHGLFKERSLKWRSVHRILDVEDHRCHTDLLEFQFFELGKLRRLYESGGLERETGLERLLRYLGRIGGEAEMERLAEQDAGIERLRRGERLFFRTPGNLALYRMHEREETDYHNTFRLAERKAEAKGMTKGRAKGFAEGRADGLNEGRIAGLNEGRIAGLNEGRIAGLNEGRIAGELLGRQNTARTMLREGMSPNSVARFTGLSPDEVEALREETGGNG